ncbi:MAG: winged helix-turn-helix transcriptional regulator [Clostridia bacterium]|nr:winged helix-turn-helix transcriptional regulator [Clostridia bacterium]
MFIYKFNVEVFFVSEDKCVIKKEVDIDDLYDLSELFKVFGDSTRIRIISLLIDGEMCVYHIADNLGMNHSAISHQLRILRSAGLVRPRKDGKTVYYSLDDEHVEMIFKMGLEHILHKNEH